MRSLLLLLLLGSTAAAAPMDEVNAQRANFGLPPLVEDAALSQWAQMKAEWQASRGICLDNGYNGHEGPNAGPGYTEGTGCLPPSWRGWATCAMRVRGSHRAGAGVAIGPDGNRYMCLVIAGQRFTESNIRRSIIDTHHLTPSVVRVGRAADTPRRMPRNRGYVPVRYPGLDLRDFLRDLAR